MLGQNGLPVSRARLVAVRRDFGYIDLRTSRCQLQAQGLRRFQLRGVAQYLSLLILHDRIAAFQRALRRQQFQLRMQRHMTVPAL